MVGSVSLPKPKKYLNADALIAVLRRRFDDVGDTRRSRSVTYSLTDTLTAAMAMFSLKEPSLLAFQDRRDEPAIKKLFQLTEIPADSTMREILDGIDIDPLNEAFADLFYELQRGGMLKKWRFHDEYYLLAVDGTGHFCSSKVHCKHCLEKNSKSGKTYHHQAVAATLVHPETREVIPLAVEPIIKQDGQTKNDCERNASARLLRRIRRLHPKLKLIVVEDGLASNAPHIELLRELNMRFLLGVKPGDHQHLYEAVISACDRSEEVSVERKDPVTDELMSQTMYVENLPLNKSNDDLRVNFLQHNEFESDTGEVCNRFGWVSDLAIPQPLLPQYVAGGRSRWRVENETFNTLKNQGYQYEHNFGHGKENLCTVLMLLMFLAFTVDQIQQACCPVFIAVWEKLGSKRNLWDHLRSHVRHFVFESFSQLWRSILLETAMAQPPPR